MESENNYLYPVELFNNARIMFTESPAHVGRLQFAVDFIIPIGTFVKAALDGTVVNVKQDSGIGGLNRILDKLGNYIEIKHDNDEYSIYEHIAKNGSLVEVGDEVKAGQTIGYSGSTGWIAHLGPHLHFNVHKYFGEGPEDYETLDIAWKNPLQIPIAITV